MGTHVLLLLLGCWVLVPRGALDPQSRPQLTPRDGLWVAVGSPLILQCFCPGPEFHLFHGNDTKPPVKTETSDCGFVTFNDTVTRAAGGLYFCRCPPGPKSEAVKVVVIDPDLDPPELSLPPPQPLPVPEGTNISVVCKGPPGAATFQLYRGGPGGAVGKEQEERGGAASFTLGPLHPRDEGAYFCTYSPKTGGLSPPSPSLLILVEGGGATPKDPNWPGCKNWEGSY
ncbi:platelet glycoprotein VI-like isoform X2 [Buteo buteo]|uniref:platelet glycoprotein VI-like isoform X2 n=1 Tax=Buteo buteo TaxID=30397 RepID=UPI003EBEFFEB